MPSVNTIQIIGPVVEPPKTIQAKYTQYLQVKVMTKEVYQDKESNEIHEVRVYGSQGRQYAQSLSEGDIVYSEGSLKSYDKKFYISVKSFRVIAKNNVYPQTKV